MTAPTAVGATGPDWNGAESVRAESAGADFAGTESVGADSASVESIGAESMAQDESRAKNNSSGANASADARRPVSHRNPAEVSNRSNLSEVQSWLAREMSGRLGESVNLSQEDRERAKKLIGNDSKYARLAKQYAEVSDESRSDGTSNLTKFSIVGAVQREFLADVQRYRATLRKYRQAREVNVTNRTFDGQNQSIRTLRLAHELERHAAEINRTANRLNRSYENLTASQRKGLGDVTRTIGKIRANITRTQLTVRNQTLVRTVLSMKALNESGSFADPVTLAGQLRTESGAPVPNENVTLRIGNRTINATTDGEGRFRVQYRPTLTGVGSHRRIVEFWPDNESVYLHERSGVRMRVRQVEPTLRVSNRTRTVRYNQTVVVNGTVGAEGVGAPGVPLVVSVGDVRLGRTETGANGSFGITGRLPANVSAGRQQVRVRLALENATRAAGGPVALAPTNATVPVTVEPTPTSLSITEVDALNETAFVSGQLTTASGEPLPNQTVTLTFNGTTVGTARTNATGAYAVTVPIPERLLGSESPINVSARLAGSGNLKATRANASLALSSSSVTVADRYLLFGVAGVLGLAVLGVFVWRFRSEEESILAGGPTSDVLAETVVRGERPGDELLDEARSSLRDDRYDAAVLNAYGAARHRLNEDVVGTRTPQTHWEFYRACRDADVSEERLRKLEQLTETYEHAAFSPERTSERTAAEAVATAEDLSTGSTRISRPVGR